MSSHKFRTPLLAVFSGSARNGSVNVKLAKAAEQIAQNLGATTTFIDLGSYDLPLYDPNLEESIGMPDNAMKLKSDLRSTDGWIIASPEYNGFVTPLLLNAMTWCSRGDTKETGGMYATFHSKTACLLSASPGALGGMRSLSPNRTLLTNLGVQVIPQSVAIGGAFQAFDDSNNTLIDPKQDKMLQGAIHSLFLATRDIINRDSTCELLQDLKPVGDYGSVNVAGKAH